MDSLYNPSGWQQQPQQGHHPGQPGGRPTSSGSSIHPLDISEYVALGDGPGQSQSPYYSSYAPQPSIANYYSSNGYGAGYSGSSQSDEPWNGDAAPSAVPLSSYSELNGANGTGTSSGLSNTGSLMIDPALTTISPADTRNHHPFLPSSGHDYGGTQPQYQYQQSYPEFAYEAQQRNLQAQQLQLQGQGGGVAISPRDLHTQTPSSSSMNGMDTFYPDAPSQSHLQNNPNPQSRNQLLNSLRPLLQPTSFTGAGAVSAIINLLSTHNPQTDVDAEVRLQVLTSIRDGAGNHYFRAWAENKDARELVRVWLKAAVKAGQADLGATIMPLLHLLDRLPLTVTNLKDSKIGKIITILIKDPPAPAIKDMASNIERKWRALLTADASAASPPAAANSAPTDDPKRKRKLSAEPTKPAPPAKRQAISTSTSTSKLAASAAKKEKDAPPAKTDSSFFSAVKPKAKLPTFKKAPVPPVPPASVKQEPAFNPFQEALMGMKTRKGSPLTAPMSGITPPPGASSSTSNNASRGVRLAKNGKPIKTVRWRPDSQLEAVRLIERAIYDDDMDSEHTAHSLRDLDRSEGAALHAPHFEETIDWFEPIPLESPDEMIERGSSSTEKAVQEEREKTALGSLYITPSQIPDSPAEPPADVLIPLEKVDAEVREMKLSPEDVPWTDVPSQNHSVSDLVGQLSDTSQTQHHQPPPIQGAGMDPSMVNSLIGMNLPPEQLQNLLLQLGMGLPGLTAPSAPLAYQQQPPMQPYGGGASPPEQPQWAPGQYDFQQPQQRPGPAENQWGGSDRERNGWGQRGRGRGRGGAGMGVQPDASGHRHSKTKPCNFFMAGRCKFGDMCDFSHDPSMFQ